MGIFFLVIFSFLAIGLFLWQTSNIVSIIAGSPYVGTDRKIIREILRIVGLNSREVFYELGCGAGNVLLEAQKYKAKVVGFELSLWYYLLAKLRTCQYKNVSVELQDIRRVDLRQADVVYCYLLPKFLDKLVPKFKKELNKSARLISIGFPVTGLKLKKAVVINKRKIFIY